MRFYHPAADLAGETHAEVVPNHIIHGLRGLLVGQEIGWIRERVLQAAVRQVNRDVVGTSILKTDVGTTTVNFEPAVSPALVGFLKLARSELGAALGLRSPGILSLLCPNGSRISSHDALFLLLFF